MRKAMILLGTAVLFVAGLAAPAEAYPSVPARNHSCAFLLADHATFVRTCAVRYVRPR